MNPDGCGCNAHLSYPLGRNILQCMGVAVIFCLLILAGAERIEAARLKDIADVQGMRTNQLFGYGLVVGLNGTGDGTQAAFTTQSIVNMLERMDVNVNPNQVKVKNVAGVMITAQMPPFAKIGQKLDVVVSSLGDAKSLQGGTLLLTHLKGIDDKAYALAQGPISIGGFSAGGAAGGGVQKNHPTAGRIPSGATIEREIPVGINKKGNLLISLHDPDFTTVSRAAEAINDALGADLARPLDAETVSVNVPPEFHGNVVGLIASIEGVDIDPDRRAKVVLDERTGTVVMGEKVKISTVAIAHGNLSIQIKEGTQVSQPPPFSTGATVVTPESQVSVQEGGGELVVLDQGASIGELVRALNAVGVTPRDLIAILHSVKAAGALQADLNVI
jgi:flagellar P-ring protein precursor FlgI